MSNQPFGPFGPSYDGPPQTTPNPTVPTPVQNSSYAPVGIPAPADPYVGGYSGGSRATPGQCHADHCLGATGLTFFDDDVISFFSPHARGKSAIFLLAIGKPPKRKPLPDL